MDLRGRHVQSTAWSGSAGGWGSSKVIVRHTSRQGVAPAARRKTNTSYPDSQVGTLSGLRCGTAVSATRALFRDILRLAPGRPPATNSSRHRAPRLPRR